MASEVIDTVWIQRSLSSREIVHAIGGSRKLGYRYGWGACEEPGRCVPVGDVDFCEKWLGYSPVPDFYPRFLALWMRREWWIQDGGTENQLTLFVKSAERYKAFPATVVNSAVVGSIEQMKNFHISAGFRNERSV